MRLITETAELREFCSALAEAKFVTVDTEFMRERTYWPILCLIQLGGPDDAAAVDALAEGLDLSPVYELMRNEAVLKVFHAARQDLEIFHKNMGAMPKPVFDTQVAAMVCGFGDQAAYDTLAAKLAKAHIDKSSRFTDWSRRPLSERQLQYAIADVTHLRVVYEKLQAKLQKNSRAEWLTEEMQLLTDPATYDTEPLESWRRLKPRNPSQKLLRVLRELAAWRESEAQRLDIPRSRVLRDESILEIAAHAPTDAEQLARTRGLSRGMVEGKQGAAILAAVQRGLESKDDVESDRQNNSQRIVAPPAVTDMLKVLLKLKCDLEGVAPKLIASSREVELIAADDNADVPALHGWRREIYGADALKLKHGKLALVIRDQKLALIDMDQQAS
ncbi:MAG: rnd [Alphaproteobacteria bacterium]|nr:rnd [Alphaproteobacteria bacterium]